MLSDLERLGAPGVPQCLGDGGERPPIADVRASNRSGDDAARQLRVDRRTRTVHIQKPVDLGGIGKGLALRWADRAAAALLPGSFLIDAGGDIVCRGAADDGPWSIGIEDPLGGSLPVATCAMGDGEAIATSSIRLGRWLDPADRLVHHLIDPRTGEPGGTGLAAVTVAWGDPAWAEVWSKALFLEGADAIAGVARRRGLAAWWISDGGNVSMTPAARQRTTWVRGEGATG